MDSLSSKVKTLARKLGFDLVGITSAEPFRDDEAVTLERVRQGLMDGLPWYTEARVRRGSDPKELLPGARSVISVGMSYYVPGPADSGDPHSPGDGQGASVGKVARYAWGDDYHKVLKDRLKQLAEGLTGLAGQPVQARWYVDDGPMLDRAVARRAGVGWFGKSTNILSPSHGSWIYLGQLITDLELEQDTALKKTCGSCVRCIDDCPTGAIVAPYVVDNRLCISYQTIENRGAIPVEMRPLIGSWVFGCDICQDVCPVNRKAATTREDAFHKLERSHLDLIALLELTDEEFRERYRHSPIWRTKRAGLQRNACVALGNLGDPAAAPALSRVLSSGEPLVRGHAAWALGRIGGIGAVAALEDALGLEHDPVVRDEILDALGSLERQPG